ncbi:unnamed protein product, partial [Strongylus vulgaris]
MGERFTEEEVDEIIKEVDKDGDEQVIEAREWKKSFGKQFASGKKYYVCKKISFASLQIDYEEF